MMDEAMSELRAIYNIAYVLSETRIH